MGDYGDKWQHPSISERACWLVGPCWARRAARKQKSACQGRRDMGSRGARMAHFQHAGELGNAAKPPSEAARGVAVVVSLL